ncbi:MAG: SusC/RagA family TonB-linked outer membrane protein, partial [Alistipes sp.]|nr:SusC/RagA family TonB-linked outer membrane protein [Alistipes sp.]
GIDLSVMFQGVAGNYIYITMKQLGMRGTDGANMVTDVLSAWDYNSTSSYPRLGIVDDSNNNYQYFSDIFLERGDYLRLKNLTVGYTVPSAALRKIGMEKCRIRAYVSMENLVTWTKYSGTDPEVGNYGIDRGVYPLSRFFNFGINLNF